MAREATVEELALFRTPGGWSRIWLAVYQPNTIYTARLASVPSSTDRVIQISFTSGSGTLSDVKAEMTLWVGSSAGARDLGICRIRKAPISGTFYIGMTSEIDWESDCYLTVVDHFPLCARVPIMDGGTLKMDSDISYSNQHVTFDPVPVLGSHAIEWLTGASVDVEFDASDSWVFGSTISAYSWSAPGASASSGTTTATPTFTYNAAGYYRVYCTVTAANGKSYTGIRHVFILDTENMPQRVEITDSPACDRENGGWTFAVKIRANADTDDIVEGALAVLFAEDHYGATEQSIGPVSNRENIVCMGYVAGETIEWDYEDSTVEFSVVGAHDFLSRIEINPFDLFCAANTPADWTVMSALTVDRAAFHLLHWRSNVTALMDFYPSEDTRYAPKLEASSGSVWDQLKGFGAKIYAGAGVDRFGRLFLEIHPNCVSPADRTWATVMTVTKKDYVERVSVTRSTRKKISMLSSSGGRSNAFGDTTIIYSLAMGHVQTRHGRTVVRDQLLAESQAQFNELTGLAMGRENAEFEFEFAMPYNNRLVDCFPRQYLEISLAAEDTPRGLAYSGNLIPKSVTLRFDEESNAFTTELGCDPETSAELAVNGDIPPATGVDGWDLSTFPPFDMPSFGDLPDISILPPSIENNNHPRVVAVATTAGVFYTESFNEDSPVWKAMNAGLSEDYIAHYYKHMVVTPSGALWMIVGNDFNNNLYRASRLGAEWTLVGNANTIAQNYGLNIGKFLALAVNPVAGEGIAVSLGLQTTLGGTKSFRLAFASGASLSIADEWTDYGTVRLQGLVYRGGKWHLFWTAADTYMSRFSGSGALETTDTLTTNGSIEVQAVANGDEFIYWDRLSGGTPGFYLVTAAGAVTGIDTFAPARIRNPQGIAMSPDGVNGLGSGPSVFTPYKTTDGGDNWSSAGGTIAIGSDIWENCKDRTRFIFGGGTTLKLTVDHGATAPIDKAGNLAYVAGAYDIVAIRYIA